MYSSSASNTAHTKHRQKHLHWDGCSIPAKNHQSASTHVIQQLCQVGSPLGGGQAHPLVLGQRHHDPPQLGERAADRKGLPKGPLGPRAAVEQVHASPTEQLKSRNRVEEKISQASTIPHAAYGWL